MLLHTLLHQSAVVCSLLLSVHWELERAALFDSNNEAWMELYPWVCAFILQKWRGMSQACASVLDIHMCVSRSVFCVLIKHTSKCLALLHMFHVVTVIRGAHFGSVLLMKWWMWCLNWSEMKGEAAPLKMNFLLSY